MAKFKIIGNTALKGKIEVSGAKNAALKIIPAAILGESKSIIKNVPDILDIHKLLQILESIGVEVKFENNIVELNPTKIKSYKPDEKLVKHLRGSIVLVGALLAKYGKAIVSQPGGCLIGARSIDDHLDVFAQLGIKISYRSGKYFLNGMPKAAKVVLRKMSVTATENAILASVLSTGTTEIHCAAAEPEITDLANFLNSMGAKIEGAGTHIIKVTGVKKLSGTEYEVMPDRIEACTYLMLALASNSELIIGPIIPDTIDLVLKRLADTGAKIEVISENNKFYLKTKKHNGLTAQNVDTRPYPGFPTDIQSPYAVLATQMKGQSLIFETMFEGRFSYLEELRSMRADALVLNPHEIAVNGAKKLVGTEISSKDIRGGAALVIASLIAKGTTIINDIEYIDRGYEKIDEKLKKIGAKIERINE